MARARRSKQISIAATRSDRHQDIDDLAGEIHELTENWQKLGSEMTEKRTELVDLMERHKITEYKSIDHDPPLVITLKKGSAKISVKKAKQEGVPQD